MLLIPVVLHWYVGTPADLYTDAHSGPRVLLWVRSGRNIMLKWSPQLSLKGSATMAPSWPAQGHRWFDNISQFGSWTGGVCRSKSRWRRKVPVLLKCHMQCRRNSLRFPNLSCNCCVWNEICKPPHPENLNTSWTQKIGHLFDANTDCHCQSALQKPVQNSNGRNWWNLEWWKETIGWILWFDQKVQKVDDIWNATRDQSSTAWPTKG